MQLRIFLTALLAAYAVTGLASDRLQQGKEIYQQACARCHDTGADGAPVIGQTGDWASRSDLWEAILFEHAEKGYTKMPARGGDSQLSDYEVDVAAEYMLATSHPELPKD